MGLKIKHINTAKKTSNSFDIEALLKKEITFFGQSFNNKKKEAFYSELFVLLDAGLELREALELIANEQKKETDKAFITNINLKIINGKDLSDALKEKKEISSYEYFSIEIGERAGVLNKVIEELGLYYKRRNEQKRLIINALSYPIIILSTAFLALFFMLQFVVPMFADIFEQNNVELPYITIKIIALSDAFTNNYLMIGLVLILIVVSHKLLKRKLWYEKWLSVILLKTPFIGDFSRKVKMAQFTQALTLLIGAKVPILNGIQLTQQMIAYYPLQAALKGIEHDVLMGKSLANSMKTYSIFDSKMISLVKVAEETNQNHFIFKRLTDQYNKDIEYKSKTLSTLLEPLIILLLGVIVAVILIAMYIPMFKLSTAIG